MVGDPLGVFLEVLVPSESLCLYLHCMKMLTQRVGFLVQLLYELEVANNYKRLINDRDQPPLAATACATKGRGQEQMQDYKREGPGVKASMF